MDVLLASWCGGWKGNGRRRRKRTTFPRQHHSWTGSGVLSNIPSINPEALPPVLRIRHESWSGLSKWTPSKKEFPRSSSQTARCLLAHPQCQNPHEALDRARLKQNHHLLQIPAPFRQLRALHARVSAQRAPATAAARKRSDAMEQARPVVLASRSDMQTRARSTRTQRSEAHRKGTGVARNGRTMAIRRA